MTRIDKTLRRLKNEKRSALVLFLTAGDSSVKQTVDLVRTAFDAGADIVEIGVPFSDPVADGPVIQESFLRAIEKGTNIKDAMEIVKKVRKTHPDLPLVFMLTCNLVVTYGVEKFMKDSAICGVDGLILPDVPPEEIDEFAPSARKHKLSTILLAAPTSTNSRLKKIASKAKGFVYYINVTGVTGKKIATPKDVAQGVKRVRKFSKLPVIAGFGVTEPKQAKAVANMADGVVIGSQAIRVIKAAKNATSAVADLKKFVRSIRRGLDGK